MKRLALFFLVLLSVSIAHASYMNWQVSASDFAYANSDTAMLYVDGSLKALTTDSQPMSVDIGSVGINTTFYVELANWNGSSYDVMARSDIYTYADVSGSITETLEDVSRVQSWHAGNYKGVPEPTSGLLVMLGVAWLGLKRRKV